MVSKSKMTYICLSDVAWLINHHPDEAEIYENNDEDPRSLNDEDWMLKPFENHKDIELKVPTHRFSKEYQTIIIHKNDTVREILHKIYHFYQSPIDKNAIFNFNEDCLGYVEWAKNAILDGETPKWIEIMGDLLFFQGIFFKNNSFELDLGS